MRAPGRGRRDDQRGAVAVIVAVAMSALLITGGIVLDFGLVRWDRQTNKSAADAAVTAGLRAFDTGDGEVHTYRGVCGALSFLKANLPTLSGLAACTTNDAIICKPGDSTTYASYYDSATFANKRYDVWIKAPYVTTDSTTGGGFPEESANSLSYDLGDPATTHGCNQIGVVIKESTTPGLGRIVSSNQLITKVRSVGRVQQAPGDQPVAMLILERTQCKAVDVSGTGSQVKVRGNGPAPGLIQVDSIGDPSDSSCSGGAKVMNSSVADGIVAGGASSSPLAEDGTPTTDPPLTGILGSTAMYAGNVGTAAGNLTSVYAEPNPPKYGPVARQATGRLPLDKTYRQGVQDAISEAKSAWAAGASYVDPAGNTMTSIGTGATSNCPSYSTTLTPAQKNASALYLNCSPAWNSASPVFPNAKTVIITGSVSKNISFPVASRVYIKGDTGSSAAAIKLTSTDAFRMHQGSSLPTTCSDTTEAERARLVIGGGQINTSGTLELCHTSVVMMGADYSSGCVPSSDGALPMDFPCPGNSLGNGTLNATGGSVEWTAPNRMADPPDPAASAADRRDLEDLALWTETGGSHKLTGGGGVHLKGVFMMPNAMPATFNGGSTWLADDAQFIARTLNITGGARLGMQPNPYNAPKIPALKGFELVR